MDIRFIMMLKIELGRYIVGDNDYIEQVLEILVKDVILLNKDTEIMLKVSKYKNTFLVFDVINEKGMIQKEICRRYSDVKQIIGSQSENLNTFAKSKIIADAMQGSLTLKSKAVKGINNIEIFNTKIFTIKGDNTFEINDLEYYKGANIAIVEDSKVDEKILQNILMKEDITLFCMHNGSEMIDLLEDEETDIIFTDINMPIMDGMLMTKKICTIKNWKNIPIISISSMAFPHELKKMELAGMNAAITKPIEAKDVHMVLKSFLIMTDKIRKKSKSRINFSFNKEVLDISKGIRKSTSNLEYLENLLKTMEYMSDTKESFENMIYDQEFIALGEYARSALTMYEEIYTPTMIKLFKDLIHFISQRQRTYLVDYVPMYKRNLKELEEEVEKYINNI